MGLHQLGQVLLANVKVGDLLLSATLKKVYAARLTSRLNEVKSDTPPPALLATLLC